MMSPLVQCGTFFYLQIVSSTLKSSNQQRISVLKENLKKRIHKLKGAMGTMIQAHKLTEKDFRSESFADIEQDVQGNNDLLVLTQLDIIADIHRQYLMAGADII